MIWAVSALALAMGALAVAMLATLRVVWLNKFEHSRCMARVAAMSSHRVTAMLIRQMADDYDSIDGEADLVRLRNTMQPVQHRQSIPALWMCEQADKIEASDG